MSKTVMPLVVVVLAGVTLAAGAMDLSKPYITTVMVDATVDSKRLLAAAVEILTKEGYAIALANEGVGTITTDWADLGDLTSLVTGDELERRISISLQADGRSIHLQLSRQRDGMNVLVPKGDKKKADGLLRQIAASLAPTAPATDGSGP